MSKLEELIAELCPAGVEKCTIEDICDISRGRVMSKDYINENTGVYPVYSSQTENNGQLGLISTYDFDGEYLTWTTDGANAGTVFHRQGKFSVTNVCGLLKIKVPNVMTKYLYYTLNAEAPSYVNQGMGNPKLMSNVMSRIKIFVPPLPVQSEVVRILDNLTELTAELTAELAARKKQFEYYKDKMLGIGCVGESYFLEDVCAIVDCPHTSPKWQTTGIPVIRNYNLINGQIDMSNLSYVSEEDYQNRIKRITPQKDDILFSREAPIGNVGIIPEKFDCCQGQRVVLLRPNQQISLPRYLLHVLQGPEVREQILRVGKMGSTVSNFNISDLKKLKFNLPPIMVQKKVVGKLDMFDSLCSNISEGLPAEIDARIKQYEYYRDKLLSFKERTVVQ